MQSWSVALFVAVFCTACGSDKNSRTPENFDATGAKLDSFVSNGSVDGYTFALFDADGTLYTRAGGNLSLDFPLLIASASKLPSAAAILTLVDSGQLDLDRPVVDYLGGNIDWPAPKRDITMRMLLSHTSSLQTQPDCLGDVSTTTLQQCVQEIADAPLTTLQAPGAVFEYGGGSYQVAGYVATLLSGQSWQDFFRARIATPLRLTTFTYGDTPNPRIAGGAISNVADEAKIMRMVLTRGFIDGQRVLSEAMVAELLRNQIEGKTVRDSPLNSGLYPGYTLGFFITNPALHPGSRGPEYSDPGLFGAVPWIDVGSGYGAVILINQDPQAGIAMWDAVRPFILDQLGLP